MYVLRTALASPSRNIVSLARGTLLRSEQGSFGKEARSQGLAARQAGSEQAREMEMMVPHLGSESCSSVGGTFHLDQGWRTEDN